MTTKKPSRNWDKIAEGELPNVHNDFYNPLVETKVEFHDAIEDQACDTAYFDFRTNRTHMSRKFLEDMVEIGGLDEKTAFRGVLKHEWGHYVFYPRECSILMFLGHLAEPQFKQYADEILGYWMDVKDNLPQMLRKIRGEDVRAMYKGMNKLGEKDLVFSQHDRKLLQQADIDPDEIHQILKEHSIDRLLTAFYQRQTEEDFGVDLGDGFLASKLEKIVLGNDGKPMYDDVTVQDGKGTRTEKKERKEGIMTIDFVDPNTELQNFILFGAILQDILKKRDEALTPYKKKLGQKYGKLIGEKCSPHHHDGIKLGDFTDDQLQNGLNEIIRKYGKGRYEKIRKYVEDATGRKFDRPERKGSVHAGLEGSTIQFHDEQVPYYERKARTFGIYVHRKPLVVDVLNAYPEGAEKFVVGDPIRTLDPFSTFGQILPGITKRKKLRQGTKRDKLYKVPHLMIWEDTSGSMRSPVEGSDAVTAAFVLARNYWENGSDVGVVNFSTDMACLFPTRNMDDIYSMLCAYWGGGTVLNIPKIREYIERMAVTRGLGIKSYTTEKDYEELIERMHPEERKQYVDKHVEIQLNQKVREMYEKLDTAMITDGGIFNLPEVIEYIGGMAKYTRNVIFLIKNPQQYDEWVKLKLPNTQIVHVDKPADLLGLAIGEAKNLGPAEHKPASLFWR